MPQNGANVTKMRLCATIAKADYYGILSRVLGDIVTLLHINVFEYTLFYPSPPPFCYLGDYKMSAYECFIQKNVLLLRLMHNYAGFVAFPDMHQHIFLCRNVEMQKKSRIEVIDV